jgi:hypothetical protein
MLRRANVRGISLLSLTFGISGSLVSSHAADGPAALSLSMATVPACTVNQKSRWRSAKDHSFNIAGQDAYGDSIGLARAGGKWYPILPTKQTICGALRQLKYYPDIDHDWALNIEPTPGTPSSDVFDAAREQGSAVDCGGGSRCVHGETNPDQNFPMKTVFGATHRSGHFYDTALQDKDMCIYGPYVSDGNHDDKIEIHPIELIWWKDPRETLEPKRTPPYSTARTVWREQMHVIFTHDDSNRFDRNSNYSYYSCIDIAPGLIPEQCTFGPGWTGPWTRVPRRSEVRIAFDADPTGSLLRSYVTQERYAQNVITAQDSDARRDHGAGTDHRIDVDGVPVLRFRELQPDDNVGIVFDEVCHETEINKLIGFAVLSVKYGIDDRGGEGFYVLDITAAEIDPGVNVIRDRYSDLAQRLRALNDAADNEILKLIRILKRPPPPIPEPRFNFNQQLRRVGSALVADVTLDVDKENGRAKRVTAARLQRGGKVIELKPEPPRTSSGTQPVSESPLIRDVPVFGGGSIVINQEDGSTYQLQIPVLAMAPELRSETPRDLRAAPQSWKAFAAAAGSKGELGAPPGELMHAETWIVDFVPRYAVLADNKPAPDEVTKVTRALNAALTKPSNELLVRLYGTSQPFKAEWQFRGSNPLSRAPVPVTMRSGIPPPGEIYVETAGSNTFQLIVRFPKADGVIYQLDAVLKTTDVYGVNGSWPHIVWSHYVDAVIDDGTSLVQTAGRHAGIDLKELANLSRLATDRSIVRDRAVARRIAHAQTIRVWSLHAMQDDRITVGEVNLLYRTAIRFASLKR